jgi:predicted phosphate transport protein (TIGR00153 family)
LGVKVSLVPRTAEFYDLFAKAGRTAHEAARKTEERFRDYPSTNVTHEEVRAIEHAGDAVTHDLVQLLNTQYVTPFDREDIYELITTIDDVVDHIEEVSARLELYDVETMSRHAIELARILATAVGHLATALAELKAGNGIGAELVKVKQLEDEGDRVVRDAIASLFQTKGIDPLLVIKWKDIYEGLEDTLDGCEKVANVIANIVVKNA